jgi:[ribosomal protein S18]-alanine N-acetyltransferase
MNPQFIIRPYIPTDKEAVMELLYLNMPKYFAREEEADLLHYLVREAEHYFVVETEGRIVASGGYNFSEDGTTGKISWDIVHPDFQGKGVGRLLTEFRMEKLRTYDRVRLLSVRTSQMAFRFYEKLGFELKEVVTDYWAVGLDLYRMECKA